MKSNVAFTSDSRAAGSALAQSVKAIHTIKASDLGKTKMLSQVAAVSCLLLSTRHPEFVMPGQVLMWGVVFFATVSAMSYFRKFWRKIDQRVKRRRRRELLMIEKQRRLQALRERRMAAEAQASRPQM